MQSFYEFLWVTGYKWVTKKLNDSAVVTYVTYVTYILYKVIYYRYTPYRVCIYVYKVLEVLGLQGYKVTKRFYCGYIRFEAVFCKP